MLTHPTLDKLRQMKLAGMEAGLREQLGDGSIGELSFEERLGLLVDREMQERENRRFTARLRQARLRQSACLEDIDYRAQRGIDRTLLKALGTGKWLRDRLNVMITGPTGAGKSYLACALGQRACRQNYRVRYFRAPRLFTELADARSIGRYPRALARLRRCDLLIIDDWGIATLTEPEQRDLLEVLDDRHDERSTLMASQLPPEQWHGLFTNPTIADAVLDRLVHSAYRLKLDGDSMRKIRSRLTGQDN